MDADQSLITLQAEKISALLVLDQHGIYTMDLRMNILERTFLLPTCHEMQQWLMVQGFSVRELWSWLSLDSILHGPDRWWGDDEFGFVLEERAWIRHLCHILA